jgi:predicted small lipoprotein YifL
MKIRSLMLPVILASTFLAGCSSWGPMSKNDPAQVNNPPTAVDTTYNNTQPSYGHKFKHIGGIIVSSQAIQTNQNQRAFAYVVRTQNGRVIKVVKYGPLIPNGTRVVLIKAPNAPVVLRLSRQDQ